VTLRHVESGQSRNITILSSWEADIEQSIFNYQAPLAQAILGSKPGDTVDLQLSDAPGKYTILSMANALLESL
jgi:transcription elongation GreA/GreB family factor